MSDDEIRAMQEVLRNHPCAPPDCGACDMLALADEALARGKAATIERMKREATEGIAKQMAQEYDALRERVAQLETALRGVSLGQVTSGRDAGSWCWCDTWIKDGEHESKCDQARAALAAGKP